MYANKFLLRTGDKLSQITDPGFFKQRLLEEYDTNKYMLEDYDYVFFDSDRNPIFVTIASDDEFEAMYPEKYLNTDFKNIDGKVYYKDSEFLEHSEDVSYWKVNSAMGPVTMIKLSNIEQLKMLHSNYDLKMPRPHFTERNVADLIDFVFKDKTPDERVAQVMRHTNSSKEA
jgi:hypothetical protein